MQIRAFAWCMQINFIEGGTTRRWFTLSRKKRLSPGLAAFGGSGNAITLKLEALPRATCRKRNRISCLILTET